MRRLRTLQVLTIGFGVLTLADLVTLLVIIFRNSYTNGLILAVTVFGIIGIVLAGLTLVLLGIWREAVRNRAQQPTLVEDVNKN